MVCPSLPLVQVLPLLDLGHNETLFWDHRDDSVSSAHVWCAWLDCQYHKGAPWTASRKFFGWQNSTLLCVPPSKTRTKHWVGRPFSRFVHVLWGSEFVSRDIRLNKHLELWSNKYTTVFKDVTLLLIAKMKLKNYIQGHA